MLSRGGGRSDGWHTLNCKGKYAGEIRIEITYYDTRPKEDRPAEARRESGKPRPQQGPRESLGGPRQLKPVLRRPLPADPVQPASGAAPDVSAPQPLRPAPPPRVQPQALARQAPPAAHFVDPPAQQQVHRHDPHEPSNGHLVQQAPSAAEAPYVEDRLAETSQRYAGRREQAEMYAPVAEEGNPMLRRPEPRAAPQCADEHESRQAIPDHSRQPAQHGHAELHMEPTPPRTSHQMTPDAPAPLSIAKGTDYSVDAAPPMRHYHSAPDPRILTGQPMAYPPREERFEAYQPAGDGAQHNVTPRRQPYVSDYEDEYVQAQFEEAEDVPPPPPAHRSGDSQPTHPRMPGRPVRGQTMPAEPSPSAYTRDLRHVAQVQHTSHASYASSPLSGGNALGHSPTTYQEPRPRPQHQPKRSPAGSFSEVEPDMPLSLVPGYDPGATVDNPARGRRETVDDGRWDGSPGHSAPVAASHRPYRPYVPPPEPSEPSPPLRHEEAGFQRPARASVSAAAAAAAAAAPPAPSAEPLRLPRKSVSPRPGPLSERNGIAQTPFSPDAFDVLNPHANTTSINDPGPQYRTPEEADVVARDLQRGQTNEPIIASDGRLIDPSDHLPTSTWAPEPERKTPMKAAASSLDLRSRPSPQGAQPMPPSARRATRESASRPHSIAGSPVYTYGGDAGGASPYATENHNATNPRRIRIQMKPRGQTSSVASTPVSTPHVAYGSHGHGHGHGTPRSIPKASGTDRDRDRDRDEWAAARRSSPSHSSYGSYNANSSIHSQGMSHAGSLGAGASTGVGTGAGGGAPPPPIPAKVPISSAYSTAPTNNTGAHEEYSALSEELRTINIGSTGRRVARRSHYH